MVTAENQIHSDMIMELLNLNSRLNSSTILAAAKRKKGKLALLNFIIKLRIDFVMVYTIGPINNLDGLS